MLKEVVKDKNLSRASKFIKLKSNGLSEKEAKSLLDRYDKFEAELAEEKRGVFLDTAKAPKIPSPAANNLSMPTAKVKPVTIKKSARR